MTDPWKDLHDIDGFSQEKGAPDYWTDAVRDFWAETDLDTDSMELRVIVKWFDRRRVRNILSRNIARLEALSRELSAVELPPMPDSLDKQWTIFIQEITSGLFSMSKMIKGNLDGWAENANNYLAVICCHCRSLQQWAVVLGNDNWTVAAAEVARVADELTLLMRNLAEGVDDDRE